MKAIVKGFKNGAVSFSDAHGNPYRARISDGIVEFDARHIEVVRKAFGHLQIVSDEPTEAGSDENPPAPATEPEPVKVEDTEPPPDEPAEDEPVGIGKIAVPKRGKAKG